MKNLKYILNIILLPILIVEVYPQKGSTYRRAMVEQRGPFERALRSGGPGYRLVPVLLSWQESLPAGNFFVFKQTWVNRSRSATGLRDWNKHSHLL